MDHPNLAGKVWKTKIAISNGNIDYGEIKLVQVARFAQAERKRAENKGKPRATLAPAAKWVIDLAIRNFEEYVKLLGEEDIGLVSIAIQCVQEV